MALPEKKERSAKADAAPPNYEAALAELEQLVARMEGGALNLEDSLTAYRRGAVLVAYCQQQLEKVDQQVRVLDGETLKAIEGEGGRGADWSADEN
jgi:exodeoxyribonuclease VII small subunit